MKVRWIAAGILAAAMIVVGGCGGSKDVKPEPQTQQTTAPVDSKPAAAQGTQYAIVAQESTASYTVKEVFLQEKLNATAVGKTSAFQGAIVLDGGALKPSTITVDLRTLKSDSSKRDGVLRARGLETNKYPSAEFAITGVEGAAPAFAGGKEAAFKLAGTLKLHGTEKPVVWDAKSTLEGETLRLTATTSFKMAEFNIEPPNILNLISVDDSVKLDVNIVAKKGN